jgi:hypothetical protein
MTHCGLSFDHERWVPADPQYRFFLPKYALRKVFRGKVIDAIEEAFAEGQIGFHGKLKHLSDPKTFRAFIHDLHRTHWVVYCKRPFGGPEQVLKYLGLPIEWPFPTIAWSLSRTEKLHSLGKTVRMGMFKKK